jgi:hypothetical protein
MGLIVRANARAGKIFACAAGDLLGRAPRGPDPARGSLLAAEHSRRARAPRPGRRWIGWRFARPGRALGGARPQRPARGPRVQDARIDGPEPRPAGPGIRLVGMTRVGAGASVELLR